MNLSRYRETYPWCFKIFGLVWIGVVYVNFWHIPLLSNVAFAACVQEPEPVAFDMDKTLVGPISLLFVEPAEEPIPALRYRFHPNPRELKPGSATPYFQRAMVQYLKKPAAVLSQFKQFQIDYEEGKAKTSIADELKPFQDVFVELRKFGECEDLRWDDRWRDLRGADLWEAMLPEFQEARDLSRLIEHNARRCLKEKDFIGAFDSIRLGFRLGEYLGQGDAIIQDLVAISRCQAMCYVVREAISTPGCPNLYWALATLPEPTVSMRRALDLECLGIEYSFPVLFKAESQELGREHWQTLWKDTFETLKRMAINGNPDLSGQLEQAFKKGMEADLGKVRKLVLSNGYSPERVASMCSEQLVALGALYEVRRRSSDVVKATFLPLPLREQELFKAKLTYEKYMAENSDSIFAIFQLVNAAADAVSQAETKQICHVRQLMTLEAIRMHVSEQGSPPASLNDLRPVSALPNPFDGTSFVYQVIEETAAWHIQLSGEPRPNVKWMPDQDFWVQKK